MKILCISLAPQVSHFMRQVLPYSHTWMHITTGCSAARRICSSSRPRTSATSSRKDRCGRKWISKHLLNAVVQRTKVALASQFAVGKNDTDCLARLRERLRTMPQIDRASAKRAYDEFVRKTRRSDRAKDVIVRGCCTAGTPTLQ